MNKDLDSFTVERLEELTALSFPPSHAEIAALARIALAAKRVEPVYQFIMNTPEKDGFVEWVDCNQYFFNSVPSDQRRTLYATPPLNHTAQDGWKLTPINPTAEMMAAAMECDDVVFDLDDDTIFCVQFDNIYAAMLAAAPEKP
ncbi:hypothetical protein [Yersinia pseudotuberculosis]|uniref:hypothetical protein n=1 Tax=Yersinia pseudotuberculosis TaxID=633 RepID=UPI00061C7B2E|nr:hypothetical protein [Yersinia pseudotuberculosis]AYX13036.1 hypothetical protein EGX52_20980 [Yersinia pseudotuberculosis]MBO1567246.1 hypothetical protein [Yersinia pseudotuberculosis]MBO1604105.1 hypothetical protein [Yersinia pseudotuberculosis]CNI88003.1 Uncharacterised protein [Yersinia pseudotuberculosis]